MEKGGRSYASVGVTIPPMRICQLIYKFDFLHQRPRIPSRKTSLTFSMGLNENVDDIFDYSLVIFRLVTYLTIVL